jgi:hypothetical protein
MCQGNLFTIVITATNHNAGTQQGHSAVSMRCGQESI